MMGKGGATVPKPWGACEKVTCMRSVFSAIPPHPHSSGQRFLGWWSWVVELGRPCALRPLLTPQPFFFCSGSQAPGARVAPPGAKVSWHQNLPVHFHSLTPDPTPPPRTAARVHFSGTGWVFPACLRFYGGNQNKETKPLFYFCS